jgi:DNA-3-methyladenine glycosylase I
MPNGYFMELTRCEWAIGDPLMQAYHDDEWGVAVHEDRLHFEMLTLEGAQAGLSWMTILRKREGYRNAFSQFDPEVVAQFGEADVERLMADPGIVRNRAKIRSTIGNAQAFLLVATEFGSFDAYIWRWVDGRPVRSQRRAIAEVPAKTELSDRISKDLLKRGFKFVGSTIVYSYLQATGLVDDHVEGCFRSSALP